MQRTWHPDAFASRYPYLLVRNQIMGALRSLFRTLSFEEVETPALQASPGLDPHLEAFRTILREPFGSRDCELFLHTSPEYAMKKLLVAGVRRPFQFARVFRNEMFSPMHHPEFTMLEWYRTGEPWLALVEDCESVISTAVGVLESAEGLLRSGEHKVPVTVPFERVSVAEAFFLYAGIDILESIDSEGGGIKGLLYHSAKKKGFHVSDKDTWADLFFRIFVEHIEQNLGVSRPLVLYDWPAPLAALARIDPQDSRVALRFEVYVGGMELANGFEELTDPAEHRKRFNLDRTARATLNKFVLPIDEDFLAALDFGMPSASGIALGLDRLIMLVVGATSIENVLWLPVSTSDSS